MQFTDQGCPVLIFTNFTDTVRGSAAQFEHWARHVSLTSPQKLNFGKEDRSGKPIRETALGCDMLMVQSVGGVQNQHEGKSDRSLKLYTFCQRSSNVILTSRGEFDGYRKRIQYNFGTFGVTRHAGVLCEISKS